MIVFKLVALAMQQRMPLSLSLEAMAPCVTHGAPRDTQTHTHTQPAELLYYSCMLCQLKAHDTAGICSKQHYNT